MAPDTQTVDAAQIDLTEGQLKQEADRLVAAYRKEIKNGGYNARPKDFSSGRAILDSSPRLQVHTVFTLQRQTDWSLDNLRNALFARVLPWTADDLERLVREAIKTDGYSGHWSGVLRPVKRFVEQGNVLTDGLAQQLNALRKKLQGDYAGSADTRKIAATLDAILGEDMSALPDAGETWADIARADVSALPPETQSAWKKLFALALNSDGARPSASWREAGKRAVAVVGKEIFCEHVARWLTAVTSPPLKTVHGYQASAGSDRNLSMLKGLAWLCGDQPGTELARTLGRAVEGSLKKIPGVGPWGVRAATGAVWALTEMDSPEAVAQLSRLKTRVTFRTALNQIENGLEVAAERAGVSKADLEDMGVPVYGFGAGGLRREAFGESVAVATLTPSGDMTVEWFGAGGKPVKSPPASVKKEHAAELKEFKADVDAATRMLTAQKGRFDSFYLPERVWRLKDWRERFADHPLLGNVTHRLLWHVSESGSRAVGLWDSETKGFADATGVTLTWLTDGAEVRLWHPLGAEVADVLAWRERLSSLGVIQPFKQAHREVYVLTEAERNTHTYSNRYAGHLLKQHQMNSLAALRGWKNKLRLMVDDVYPPATKELPELGLRAEFWIEGAGDNYGTDTTETGTYLYLTTDQVRFYRLDAPENYAHAGGGGYGGGHWGRQRPAEPLPMEEVPPLAFSEIMRDVDLFVGVCSVGNDPTWQDGGPQGRYRNYWEEFSFGDLTETAQTRRGVLERLLPRLKIAARCTLGDKFLVVRGDRRTYKIHLGSGNILMEPNDQYLCIVQDRAASRDETTGFLPFEGDHRLALILSKAFLLADDTRITDPTILRQITPVA